MATDTPAGTTQSNGLAKTANVALSLVAILVLALLRVSDVKYVYIICKHLKENKVFGSHFTACSISYGEERVFDSRSRIIPLYSVD